MNLSKKWIAAIATAALTGVLVTGAAFAAGEQPAKPETKASPAVQEIRKEIWTLRKSRMEQLKADVNALVDKALAEGKINQEEAARLKAGGKQFHRFGKEAPIGKCPGDARPGSKLTEGQIKSRLADAVKAGKITQEQADQMLKRWQERHAQPPSESH